MGVIAFLRPLSSSSPHLVSSFYGLTKESEKRTFTRRNTYSPKEEGLTKLFLATMNRRIFIPKVLFPLPFFGVEGGCPIKILCQFP